MKITLNFDDIEKIIKEAYTGVNSVLIEKGAIEDVEFTLDVDGDKFSRNRVEQTKPITNSKTNVANEMKPGATVDYDALMVDREIIKSETTIPLVKTLKEKNKEAEDKGLMTTGRGSSRPTKNLG